MNNLMARHPVIGSPMTVGADVLRRAIYQARVRVLQPTQIEGRVKTMGNKSEYVMALVAEDVAFPETVVAALKHFKKNHKFNSPLPFEQATAERFAAMTHMLNVFCEAYQMEPPELRLSNISPHGESARAHYNSDGHYILMTGKLSVITFLHEFAHVLGYDEEQARKWSLCLFKKVYPIAFDKLHMGDPGNPTSFYLVRNPVVPLNQPMQMDGVVAAPAGENAATVNVERQAADIEAGGMPQTDASNGCLLSEIMNPLNEG